MLAGMSMVVARVVGGTAGECSRWRPSLSWSTRRSSSSTRRCLHFPPVYASARTVWTSCCSVRWDSSEVCGKLYCATVSTLACFTCLGCQGGGCIAGRRLMRHRKHLLQYFRAEVSEGASFCCGLSISFPVRWFSEPQNIDSQGVCPCRLSHTRRMLPHASRFQQHGEGDQI